jgi:MoaA/NifB/PqqE/SkfB family radical SAM enzyme
MTFDKRESLKDKKPLVYNKIQKCDEKLKRGESIGIIQLQYDYACNFKCKHCSIKKFQNQGKRKLSPEVVKRIYQDADKLGLARTVISGGEPLLFKDLTKVIEAINPEKFYICIDTNGTFLTKEKAIFLKELGVDRIQPSIDNLKPKEHDEFRRCQGAHVKAMEAVYNAKSAGLDVFVQTVVDHNRLHSSELLEFIKFFNSMDISVFITFAKPVGAYEHHFSGLINKADLIFMRALEGRYKVFTHLTPNYGQDLGCPAGKNIFSITQYGDVLICPYFHCSMGNLFSESLATIMDRMAKLTVFNKPTCLLAEDRAFIDKYLIGKIYGKDVPVSWKEVFTEGELESD